MVNNMGSILGFWFQTALRLPDNVQKYKFFVSKKSSAPIDPSCTAFPFVSSDCSMQWNTSKIDLCAPSITLDQKLSGWKITWYCYSRRSRRAHLFINMYTIFCFCERVPSRNLFNSYSCSMSSSNQRVHLASWLTLLALVWLHYFYEVWDTA